MTCVVLNGGAQCWGEDVNGAGLLGYDTVTRVYGDIDDSYGEIDIGQGSQHIVDVTIGWRHACALLSSYDVRCWGVNTLGALGTGDGVEFRRWHAERIGMGNVALGGLRVDKVRAGTDVTCAIVENYMGVKCWGRNDLNGLEKSDGGHVGLAAGSMDTLGYVNLNMNPRLSRVIDLDVRFENVCVILHDGWDEYVRCWGQNYFLVVSASVSDTHYFSPGPHLTFAAGFGARSVHVGWSHACVISGDGSKVKCWGVVDYLGTSAVSGLEAMDLWTGSGLSALSVSAWNSGWGVVEGSVGSKLYVLRSDGVLEKLNDGGGVFVDPFARSPGDGKVSGVAFMAGGSGEYAFGAGAGCLLYESGRVECWADAFHNGLGVDRPFNATPAFLDLDASLNTTFVDVVVSAANIFGCNSKQDLVCEACPDGYSCGGSFAVKCSCGSNGVDEYYRLPGTQCNLTYADTPVCAICPAGSWCSGDLKYACGANSFSEAGTNNVSGCVCNSGYFGSGGVCNACPVDFFCPGGDVLLSCNDNAISDAFSDNGTEDCACRVGYERTGYNSNGPVCAKCTSNEHCEGGVVIVECPDVHMILPSWANTSVELSDCFCRPGYFLESENVCAVCPANSFCEGDTHVAACWEHSTSPAGRFFFCLFFLVCFFLWF